MRRSHRSAAVLITIILLYALALSSLALSGCHTAQASLPATVADARHSSPAGSSAKASGEPLLEGTSEPASATGSGANSSRPSKHPARDSEFAVYHNPDYGVSFRYPRNYALVESADSDDPAFLRDQQQLAAAQPGATLVAVVSVPDDAYPNTTFRSGSLQLAVNPAATVEACRALAAASGSDVFAGAGSLSVHGIPFDWRVVRNAPEGGDAVEQVTYSGYSGGRCYEFLIEVTSSQSSDSTARPADVARILRPLEKIVSSLQLHAKAESPSESR